MRCCCRSIIKPPARPIMRIFRTITAALLFCFGQAVRGQEPRALTLSGDYARTHDPCIAQDGKTYYVFATGRAPDGGQLAIRCSTDLTDWKLCGHVFAEVPA